jgi:hypothetical protein
MSTREIALHLISGFITMSVEEALLGGKRHRTLALPITLLFLESQLWLLGV